MVKARDVAKLFLAWASENGDVITNLKLQKLLYYAQAWYLVNYDRRLFQDDIEAWEFGPVVRRLYGQWKQHKASPIPYQATGREASKFQKHQLFFLEEFFRVFNNLSATALVSMTHAEAPWKDAYSTCPNSVIAADVMKRFYRKLYTEKYG